MNGDYVVLDFETTNVSYGNPCFPENRIVLASFMASWEGVAHTIQGNEYAMAPLVHMIEHADFLVAHNAKFELGWLKRCGLDLTGILVYDTMIAEYVLAGNRKWPLNLGAMSKRYGYGAKEPYVDLLMKSGTCPSEIPRSMLVRRCEEDVRMTNGVFKDQLKAVQAAGLLPVVYTRCILTPALADIESRGMYLDEQRVSSEYEQTLADFIAVDRRLEELTGGINLRSPKQLGEFIYGVLGFRELKDRRGNYLRTASGNPRTDSGTLDSLVARTKKQREFLELKAKQGKLNAALTKNLEFFKGVCDEKGSLFYGQFNQCVTGTHRLSSSGVPITVGDKKRGVQFQNLPRSYKSLFTARAEGWSMCEIDEGQLEFRVAAFLGQDSVAVSDIRNGVDVHSFTAKILTEAGQATSRQEAKAHTFKPLYGGSSGTKAEQTYYSAFKEKYQGIASTQQGWIDRVLAGKKLKTTSGLTFYWKDTTISSSGYVSNTTAICNYPVQSFATAEIIPIAVTYFWHRLKRSKCDGFIVNTIHDSVVCEVPDDQRELFTELAVQSFNVDLLEYLRQVYNVDFNVPLSIGVKHGKHWGEGEEQGYSTE